ncbi:MAG TPA: peptidoglycan DD-metalloendopeptidase family protein [Candidatus Stackebrandtia excrementipullorum]|nr:peptidoglycan DD-metalloendopeptidase family protein [Candidatus Stackebrandtia excrementipullorum]
MPNPSFRMNRRRLFAGLGAGAVIAAVPAIAHADDVAINAGAWSNPTMGRITSGFKPPSRPYHAGTDVANSQGTAIWAANAGTVIGVRTNSYPGDMRDGLLPGRTGNAVLIDHGNGYKTYYGHLYSAAVSRNQTVSAGQVIGAMGTTGNSTGPHLHFEVHQSNTPINPYTFLANRGITLGSSAPIKGSWPNLRRGNTGGRVRVAQRLLNAHGVSTVVDGDFGPGCEASVKAFQRAKGLVADGWIGPVSWPLLVLDVRSGSSGSRAKAAQQGLNRHGYGLLIDGDFGSVSVAACRSFQKAKGLVVDGWVGQLTWMALVK